MWVILATIIPIFWYYFDLPSAAFVEYPCILIIVISTIVNKNVKSVLFFLGTVMLFLVAWAISWFYAMFAIFLVLFAAGIMYDSAKSKKSDGIRSYGGGVYSNPNREPIIRPANTGYGGYTGTYDHINDYEEQERHAEEQALYYRRLGNNEHMVNAADDFLGRSPQQRDYEDEMHAARCFGCGEIERECCCCRECNVHPCMC